MRGMIAGLLVWAGNAVAHQGHGAPEGHFHSFGIEHALLLAAVVGFIVYALKK